MRLNSLEQGTAHLLPTMDRTTASDAQWMATQMPAAVRTNHEWNALNRSTGRFHAGLESLYGQPMSKELNDLARLLRPNSPHSPGFPVPGQGESEEGSPTYMLLNLLGLLPGMLFRQLVTMDDTYCAFVYPLFYGPHNFSNLSEHCVCDRYLTTPFVRPSECPCFFNGTRRNHFLHQQK